MFSTRLEIRWLKMGNLGVIRDVIGFFGTGIRMGQTQEMQKFRGAKRCV